jgi:hypothetical protein
MSRRNQKRDRLGRFAGAGTKVSATAKGARTAAKTASKTGAKKVKGSYVHGSFEKNLEIGPEGSLRSVQVGADFRSPKGRAARVRASVGYQGKPDRRLNIEPSLEKSQKKLTVTAQPNVNRRAGAGTKVRR